jgi:hypothetical protein
MTDSTRGDGSVASAARTEQGTRPVQTEAQPGPGSGVLLSFCWQQRG